MKIAMIGHKRVPSREGGIELVVGELSTRMAAQGHSLELYNRWERGIPKSPNTYQGVRIHNIPTFHASFLNAFVYSALATVCALFRRYDVIHIHAEGPAAMSCLVRLFRIPCVVTIHGLDWQRGKWSRFASSYLKWAESVAAKYADEIIVLSESAKRYFWDTYRRETHLIPNCVSVKAYCPPQDISALGLEKDGYILFLARIVPEKGLHYLIEAFTGVETDKKLVIAGDLSSNSGYIQEIRRMAGQDDRIILAGFVQGRLWEELYSNCCLYVLPSDVEGMALSLLEALSYGIPCLVSDIEENCGIADSYVHFFRKGDVSDLRMRLQQCLSLPRQEGQAQWIRERYSYDGAVEETLAIYRKAMKKYERTDG